MSEPVKERKQFGSQIQFILSCVSYAVGLGNLWRFPSLAYANGGGAFLLPYLCCSFIVGLPILYLELTLGQFSRAGAAVAHGRIRPYAQGIGWGMACLSALVATYYNVIMAWILIFLFTIVTGQSYKWSLCTNSWNTANCTSSSEDKTCREQLGQFAFWYNGSCHDGSDRSMFDQSLSNAQSATEQFFENHLLKKTDTMDDFGGFNWWVLLALVVAWMLTALALSHGVTLIGKLSYFTGTVPYVIIGILFVRAVTLPGARIGLDFYLLKPDFSKALTPKAWQDAATQVCYSLSVGFGGLLSLASFNPRHQPSLRDALILVCSDGFMSIFGGTVVFSILGFMSQQQQKSIDQVITSGTGLAFVAYPEATNAMPVAWLWAFLFFFMLFILGIGSQFGLAQVICTSITDQFPQTRAHRKKITAGVCFVLFLAGLVMTTRAGIFYFTIFNDYSASFAVMFLILLEIIVVIYIYGVRNYIADLRTMFGNPKNKFTRVFGPTGYYFMFIWAVVAPAAISVLIVLLFKDQVTGSVAKYGDYKLQSWSAALAWILSLIPLLTLPLFVVYNILKFKKKGQPLSEMCRVQPKWPSAWKYRDDVSRPETDSSSSDVSSANVEAPTGAVYKIHPSSRELEPEFGWSSVEIKK